MFVYLYKYHQHDLMIYFVLSLCTSNTNFNIAGEKTLYIEKNGYFLVKIRPKFQGKGGGVFY